MQTAIAAASQPSIVSKSQYASLKNVSPGRVTQWLTEGKIGPDALAGEGRNAKIIVPVADAHLRRNLDISQRLGNGLSTRLGPTATQPLLPALETVSPAPAVSPADPIEEQIKREKLEGLQRENRRRAEEEEARAGRYVETASAQQEMAKIAAQTVTIIEGALPQIAGAFAAQFSIPQRDVLHLLRAEFRDIRTAAAASLRDEALRQRETFEVDIEPPSGPETSDLAAE